MTLETLIQKRTAAHAEYAECQKKIQDLVKAHGEAVNELQLRQGQIITLNGLIDELSPKPEPVSDPHPKLEVVKLKAKPKK